MNGFAEPLHHFHAGLTIGQAASALGVSSSTVRRWVRSGRLHSDQVAVGDGFEYRILLEGLEGLEGVKGSANPFMEPTAEAVANGSMDASVSPIMDASMERSVALAAYNAQLVAPLAAVIERQSETIREQAEALGRQGAELERATSTVVALGDELAATEASRHRGVRLLIAAAVVLACLALVAGVFMATDGWLR